MLRKFLLMEPRCCHPPATTMTADVTLSNSVWSAGPWLSVFYINQGNVNQKGLLFKTGSDRIICDFKVVASVLPTPRIVASLRLLSIQLQCAPSGFSLLKLYEIEDCLLWMMLLATMWHAGRLKLKRVTVSQLVRLCHSWAAMSWRVLYLTKDAADKVLSVWLARFLGRWRNYRHATKCSELCPLCQKRRLEFFRLHCLQHAMNGYNQHITQQMLAGVHYLYAKWVNTWEERQSAINSLVRNGIVWPKSSKKVPAKRYLHCSSIYMLHRLYSARLTDRK